MESVMHYDLRDKTWEDHRGWGINPPEVAGISEKSLGNIHVVSITPGAIRGNHYHTGAREWLLVFGGKAEFAWREKEDTAVRKVALDGAAPALFKIPPEIPHAVLNTDEKDIYLVSFSDSTERGTERCEVVS